MLDNIISMDETMVSYYTPETKKQSEQWIEKGKPGLIKASRTKQMILAVFDSKSLVYSHIKARCIPINALYIVKVLGLFIKQLKKKRPCDVGPGVVVPLGQRPSAHRGRGLGVAGCPKRPGDLAPAIFAVSGSGRFFSFPESEGAAGWPHAEPEDDQEEVERGLESKGSREPLPQRSFATLSGGGTSVAKSALR
jgi:hypothetical protein